MPVGSSDLPFPADSASELAKFGDYDISVVRSLDDPLLARHEDAWDRLALAVPQRLPQLSPAWVKAYWATRVTPPASMRVYLFATRGDLLAALPLVRSGGGPRLVLPRDDHTKSGDALLRPAARRSSRSCSRGCGSRRA